MLKHLVQIHKALADETRLRALHLLVELGELCVCDVEAALGISQSKASRHLVTLKHAGLVTDRREGIWVYYRIVDDLTGPARAAIESLSQVLRTDVAARSDIDRARERRCSPLCQPAGATTNKRRTP